MIFFCQYLCPFQVYEAAKNAGITAHCTLELVLAKLPIILDKCPVLIIGWGRIGKCLAQLLQRLGTPVTVAARKEKDRAALVSLGYEAVGTDAPHFPYKLIFNTVPDVTFPQTTNNDCIRIELASHPGLVGENVVQAKGLPGRLAPESAGRLMAEFILKQIRDFISLEDIMKIY